MMTPPFIAPIGSVMLLVDAPARNVSAFDRSTRPNSSHPAATQASPGRRKHAIGGSKQASSETTEFTNILRRYDLVSKNGLCLRHSILDSPMRFHMRRHVRCHMQFRTAWGQCYSTLCLALIASFATLDQRVWAKDGSPNILYVVADDLGYSDLGCFGGEIDTPNLDAMAANGIRLTQFYNTGRCCPSRAAVLTGQYPHRVGLGSHDHE